MDQLQQVQRTEIDCLRTGNIFQLHCATVPCLEAELAWLEAGLANFETSSRPLAVTDRPARVIDFSRYRAERDRTERNRSSG